MSSATAIEWPEGASGFGRLRLRFRAWRRSRPFWGGLLAVIAGVPILYLPYANLQLGQLTVTMATTAGAGSLLIGLLMMTLGVTAWFQPLVRIFCGVAVTILSLVSVPVSNLGGFGVGLLLGLVAGGLLCSWAPLKQPAVLTDELAGAAENGAAEPGQPAVSVEKADPGEQR
ncbi:DUF6114 domain-containing protein [Kitasatospora sp. GP82]|uniref:DUF6114 domain-containing protein n=1 Tax=Kitasatospora sp. GP82 TaxID=3035089 RepID=UPI002476AE43|nr:DUF6114 domain-containing protein [Kitasatospora sp. GP82]MDH6128021.1 hypothetical protein [Kitasatospora sp. GP82]